MKIGVCTGLKNISAAAEAGFDYIEPSLTSLEKMTDAEFAYAASLPRPIPVLRANGLLPGELKVTGPSVDFGAIRAYLDLAFARASKLGIGIAVFGSGKARAVPEDFPFSEAWLQLSSFLSVAAEFGEKYSVSVAIEPLRRQECNILNLVSEAVALAAFTGKERIGVLGDTFHMLSSGEPLGALVRAGGLLSHIHISHPLEGLTGRDYPREGDGSEDSYLELFSVLKSAGYKGYVSLEAGSRDFASEGPAAASLLHRLASEAGF